MKSDNLKNVLILILLAIIGYLFFNQPEPIPEPKEPTNEELEKKIANFIIPPERAKSELDFYVKSRANIIKDSFGYDDSRSFTISIPKLQSYLDYVSIVGSRKGYDDLGIRFYMGAIPEDSLKVQPKDTLKYGLSTIFMVPTGTKTTTQEGGFFNSPPMYFSDNIIDMAYGNDIGGDYPPHRLN